jgi:hypothetical protein
MTYENVSGSLSLGRSPPTPTGPDLDWVQLEKSSGLGTGSSLVRSSQLEIQIDPNSYTVMETRDKFWEVFSRGAKTIQVPIGYPIHESCVCNLIFERGRVVYHSMMSWVHSRGLTTDVSY